MSLKNYFIVFSLFIVLMCSIGAISAISDEGLDNITSTDFQDDIVADNGENEILNVQKTEDVLNDTGDALSVGVSPQSDEKLDAASGSSKKEDLKLVNYTNFVKRGNTYYLYLTDSSNKAVSNKKLTVNFDGKTYTRTTDSYGKFGIAVTSTKSTAVMEVKFSGDDKYKAFTKSVRFYIDMSLDITIGNTKLLTNGFLRIYLSGPKSLISSKTVKISIGGKTYTRNTSQEGFIVIKPLLPAKAYTVVVKYNDYSVSKKVRCIEGNVKNPLKTYVPTVNGIPNIDVMPGNYVMGDGDAQYTVTKEQYQEVLKRDSYCLFLNNKLSKFTFFKTKASPDKYHILKREKWNVIEQAINTKMVKKNSYSYWPSYVTVNLKNKALTYSEVRDTQNTEYTCGPTSASVCSQVLKNFFSEKYFQTKAHVTSGVNIPDLKRVLQQNHFKVSYFYSMSTAIKQLAKGGAALIAYLPNHYVSVIDVSKDGKKILVSNSYGKYDVGGDSKIPTDWVTLKKFNAKFRGIGLVVKLNYNLSDYVKNQVMNYYKSMGPNFARQNTNERIPDIGL